ncbi:NAD(P)/FAD-dependent oxidoreductase [Alkalihalobacillus sp. AL-G]|uniref:NAD(P)/FAD-dependent oxidoreductase n=1 Tax=Alkalihalobacillus sp. AL-G TaxID=2926399 RepID=UPI00272B70E8|nr:NAD(P)/FAD-dependent oxidoreductase [Alkalihalobacillus sp. AL-G]WLD93244.1 NAD(P)/FAD-dependent oxidoreductase [Alkalihalobacillus sp. AL-G]
MKATDIIIIGGGPAGISAAIWCERLGLDYLLIEKSEQLGGQLIDIHNQIVDYPGQVYANGNEFKNQLVDHIQQLNCRYTVQADIEQIDMTERTMKLQGEPSSLNYQYLIVATGTSVRRLNIPGEQEMIDRGEIYSATKDRHRFKDKKVIVVGGGDRAFEGALLLAECGAEVVVVNRSRKFRAREEFRKPVLRHPGISIIEDSIVKRIHHNGCNLEHVVLESVRDGSHQELTADGVFIRIGVEPNTTFVKDFVRFDEDGYIKVDTCQRTSNASIYAVGDVCTHPVFSSISSATGQGMIAAKHLSLELS